MYELRFFFDSGSGTCLWAANNATRLACGYAVDHHALPLPPPLRDWLDRLVALYDEGIDWSDPGGPSPWTPAQHAAFAAEAAQALAALRTELAPRGFTIHDGPAHSAS